MRMMRPLTVKARPPLGSTKLLTLRTPKRRVTRLLGRPSTRAATVS